MTNIHDCFSKLLNFSEIWRLLEYIEGPLCTYFGVHRINFWISNQIKNELYKVVRDGKTNKQKIISYDSTKGIAKAVAKDGIPILANDAHNSTKFLAEVDDPKGSNAKLTHSKVPVSILTLPVFKSSDSLISANCLGKEFV